MNCILTDPQYLKDAILKNSYQKLSHPLLPGKLYL